VRHADRDSQVVDDAWEVFLAHGLVPTVTATASPEEQARCGVWGQTLAVVGLFAYPTSAFDIVHML
jgi:hypothetical protein